MTYALPRREFLTHSAAGLAALGLTCQAFGQEERKEADKAKEPPFKISLAEWSLNKALFGGKLNNLDFAKTAKEKFGIDAVEYVNQFFKDKAKDEKYLADMKKRCDDLGVKSLLIMVDGEGNLGDPNEARRKTAVENHYKWVDAAKFLGCHSIRVNAATGNAQYEEAMKLAADGLRRVSEYAEKNGGLNVIVENHGGLSSNGAWLAATIKSVEKKNCGTLPDFGNFGTYDRYKGVEETMPYAKGVSAKSHEFDAEGNETKTDYIKMMKIVLAHNYHGYVGIEYEGRGPEMDGIRATLKLLQKCQKELA